MIATVTNTSGAPVNKLASYDTRVDPLLQSGLVATGGALIQPLPFPFDRVGEIADAATISRVINPDDWRRTIFGDGHEAINRWRRAVQGGLVTLAYAVDAALTDPEELFIAAA
jgi:hypothetical protein